MALLAAAAAAAATLAAADGVKVAILAQHNPTAWAAGSPCHGSSRALSVCNAGVYAAAAATAADGGAGLLVLPEGYGLVGSPSKTSYYEPLVATGNGSVLVPCTTPGTQIEHPVQYALSCAARANAIAVASNVFVSLPNGSHRITEIVYGPTGAVLAVYHKHHLFPLSEPPFFQPGPFQPTTFELGATTYGIVICYEGFYPDLMGDWSQMQDLKAKNASAFVWSVGDTARTLPTQAKLLARKFGVGVIATEDKEGKTADVAIVNPGGTAAPSTDSPVGNLPAGNSGSPIVRFAALYLRAAQLTRDQ